MALILKAFRLTFRFHEVFDWTMLLATSKRKFATHTRKNGETVKTLLADVRIVLIYCLWFNGIIILLNCKYFHSVVDNNRYPDFCSKLIEK